LEQQSGPPHLGEKREERFKPQPVDPPDPAAIEPEPPSAPIEPETVIGAGPGTPEPKRAEPERTESVQAEPTGTTEQDEAGPIMSSLPRSRPQQRSSRRAPAKKRATAARGAAKPGRSAASGRKATTKTAGGGRAQSRSKPAANAQAKAGDAPGMPRLALETAAQVATAPMKLTIAATRRTAGFIRRGLGI
jgi:hypothetical protein